MTTEERAKLELYLVDLLGRDKAAAWWFARNPMLGDVTPNRMLEMGLAEKVYAFIADARQANGD